MFTVKYSFLIPPLLLQGTASFTTNILHGGEHLLQLTARESSLEVESVGQFYAQGPHSLSMDRSWNVF